jgi:hypothetical protein
MTDAKNDFFPYRKQEQQIMAKIQYPAHLEADERKLWKQIITQYQIQDAAGLKILQAGLEAHQRARLARTQIDEEGMTFIDRFGQKKGHPLLSTERDSRTAFLAALKLLNLEIPTEV